MSQPSVPNSSYIQASRVTGTPVYNDRGDKLGAVEDIVMTKVGGEAVYAVLSFGDVFGSHDRHYPLPWSILTYDTDRDGYVVNLTKEQISGAPHYAAGAHAELDDPAFGTRVTDYYSRPVMDPVEGEVIR